MEENEFEYFLSNRVFNYKLEKKYFGKVHKSMRQTTSNIFDFAKKISRPSAHSWCGGEFKGSVDKKNWVQSSILGLDFDKGGITIEEVYEKFKEFGIVPTLHYDTFSTSLQLRKFRVVLFLDHPINDQKVFTKIMGNLEKIFPIDTQCKNVSRIFYGGTNVNITNQDTVSLEKLLDFVNIHIVSRNKNNTRSIINYEYDANKCTFLNNTNNNGHFFASNTNINYISKERGVRIDWVRARTQIKVLDVFFEGEWLHHEELFGLATNMIYIDGGEKLMKETMEKYNKVGKTFYDENNFSILPYVKKMKYYPMPVYKFSKHEVDSEIHDIITEVRNVRGHVEILRKENKITLQVAEEKMISSFNEVLKNDEKETTYIFNLPTAIGKTRLLTDLENSVIAFPTNNLKNEVSGKMKTNFVTTPDTINFSNPVLRKKIEYYYQIGLPKKSMKIIRKISESTTSKDSQIANNYIFQLEQCNNIEKSILTTHKRVLSSESFGHQTVVFDEDPLSSLVEIKRTSISDLSGIQYLYDPLKSVLDFIHPLQDGIFETPQFSVDLEDLFKFCEDKNIFETNVFDFLRSKFFIKKGMNIQYIVKNDLPKDTKNIIMSATIPTEFYKKIYPERKFECIDIRNVAQTGSIIQYTGRSCSRDGLFRYGEKISKEVGDKTVITFKDFKEMFENSPEEIHFGNCSGYDNFKGQDIAVVGTPHRNNSEYFLLAKLMDVEFDYFDSPFRYQKVQYNGFEFMINTFDNEGLRYIQLSLIESDLVQAVGRARTLRYDCTVELYSGLPLRISDSFIIKKEIA
ncbi:hypothetical protein [Chryseobacterium shandongense]|uniref:hypothetical protein n=1 Tax=Chryseobacterium shandongense TaxID=1493872 RepID=UPI000F509672|nr:hypothetical protein [Chryseobacterium shandongense]AZA58599.1 hypothetical protein EG350_16030 [Chryseobacterium shandongense]